jgi:hypothetical protein
MTALRRSALRISTLLLLTVLVKAIGSAPYTATERWIPAMTQNVFASDTAVAKPLIDTQLPKVVATATFAMG